MRSTDLGTEMQCKYGDKLRVLLKCMYNLRITYLDNDIVTHANFVRSCFIHLKLQPNVMAAFSIQVEDYLFLQDALPFGTNFLPHNWERV